MPVDQHNRAAVQAAVRSRTLDLKFALNQLHRLHTGNQRVDADGQQLPTGLSELLHTTRVAGIGHSFGGPAVITAMRTDPRITTGVNLDGSLYPPVTEGVEQPVLLVASDGHLPSKDASWQHWCTSGHPPALAVMLPGAAHLSFTDLTALLPPLRDAGLITTAATINTIGPVDPVKSQIAQRTLITSWLKRPRQDNKRPPHAAASPGVPLHGCHL